MKYCETLQDQKNFYEILEQTFPKDEQLFNKNLFNSAVFHSLNSKDTKIAVMIVSHLPHFLGNTHNLVPYSDPKDSQLGHLEGILGRKPSHRDLTISPPSKERAILTVPQLLRLDESLKDQTKHGLLHTLAINGDTASFNALVASQPEIVKTLGKDELKTVLHYAKHNVGVDVPQLREKADQKLLKAVEKEPPLSTSGTTAQKASNSNGPEKLH